MSLRTRIVASAALATASFLLAPSALAASHPVQVSGARLKSALLPASSFGSDFKLQFAISSGKHLLHLKAKDHVSTMNCGNFEDGAGLGLFGESAVATSFVDDDNADVGLVSSHHLAPSPDRTGTSTRTTVPTPGALATASSPPSSAARLRIDSRP